MHDKQKNKVDIISVAKAARVSASTVSRSFNHPQMVNPTTRKKIDRAVRKLGYIRNRAAQTMHGIRSGTIGFVVPTIDHAIFGELVQAFSDAVDQSGFTILLASHGYSLEREYAVLRKFLEHRVDGVALIGLDHSEETFQLIESQGIPAISIWNYDTRSRLSCVGADNHAAGQLAAQHIIDLGHRDIALIYPPVDGNDRARGRMTGAMRSFSAAGLDIPPARMVEAPYSISAAKDAVTSLLAPEDLPTAIVCLNDVLAHGAIYAAMHCGLRVPQDVSVIGIGDFKGSREAEPGLTTVRLPARRIGQLAGEQISQMITGQDTVLARSNCELELLIRQTCTKPR